VNGTLSSNHRDNSREIEILNRQVNNIFDKLADIERSERQVLGDKKEAINTLAQIFERQHELGVYKEPIDTICAHVCKLARDRGLLASERWIHEVMNSKYKQLKFNPTVNKELSSELGEVAKEMWDTTRGIEFSLEEPEITSQYTDDYNINRISQKSLDELRAPAEIKIATEQEIRKADKLKSMARETAKRADLLKERCESLGIKYEVENTIPDTGIIPVVSAISERSGPSLTSASLGRYGDVIKRAQLKVEKYPPTTPELDAKFAACIDNMIMVWRGWVDEKYRKDTLSWLHVAMDKAAHGKHAAATMHATLLDDSTKRALTREQVGDKDELVLQQAMNILAMQDDLVAMHRWYVEGPEKAIAKRAKKLHRRLSNSA
jgi:hypothetical protein